MNSKKVYIIFLSILLSSLLITAQGVVQESFEYSVGTSLDSLTSTSGTGFGGTWYLQNGTDSLSSVTAEGISYDDMDYEVPYAGNQLLVSLPGGWTASRYFRALSETWPKTTGNTYWASFIFQADLEAGESLTENTYYLFKWFHMEEGVDTTEILAIGNSGGGTVYSCGSGWAGGTGDDVSDVECIGDPVWLVTKMVITDADTAATYMWINPDPSTEPSEGDADVMRYTTVPSGGITHIAIENGGSDTIDVRYDEIRMGTDFDDVSNDLYVGIEDELLSASLPTSFVLQQNYPNPFNPATTITYSIAEAGEVTLKVYDILGREVAQLINRQMKSAGTYQLTFNAVNLPSGVYFYRLQLGKNAVTKKMMLLK